MIKRERVRAALAGKQVDRPPVALWRHWPVDDQDARLLAERAIEFQQRYDWDFIKIPPSSTYCIDDYGAKHDYMALPTGRWLLGERTYRRGLSNKSMIGTTLGPSTCTRAPMDVSCNA